MKFNFNGNYNPLTSYSIKDVQLKSVDKEKYLGIIITSSKTMVTKLLRKALKLMKPNIFSLHALSIFGMDYPRASFNQLK